MKRKTNAALKTKAVELQNANVLKNKMLSIVSHDIKAPLNNLHALINLVKSGQITEAEFQKWIADLSGQVSITRDFLNGLLYWAKYQMSHDLVKTEVVELKPLVASVVEILLPQIEEKGIIVNNLSQVEIAVKADREVIVLVLKNLLSNAIKFSHRNGKIEVKSVIKESKAEVIIKDNGVGIEDNKLDKLFDFESPYTTKGTSGEVGTGLGLAFCKEFIELNGGQIWVDSKLNEGTTFHVSIPLSD
ncbi:HAMP domain-containing histidine kinase [Fulvivirga lutimaris]|nr:HAMP domain-containing histidine kinase [Fulvivirga lutimaris]